MKGLWNFIQKTDFTLKEHSYFHVADFSTNFLYLNQQQDTT